MQHTSEHKAAPLLSGKWNTTVQTPHGGQEWQELENFAEDFSVTTNPLGTPEKALKKSAEALSYVVHYPSSDFEPALSRLSEFLLDSPRSNSDVNGSSEGAKSHDKRCSVTESLKSRLLLGNGASELIDLCVRLSPGTSWRPGPCEVQYKEYERSAKVAGKTISSWDDANAQLVCIVNPCNPTGDFHPVDEVMRLIETKCSSNTWVLVDESMMPWYGREWRSQSLVSQAAWVHSMATNRDIHVFVINSWTKIWACPGLRIGSVIAPTAEASTKLRKWQVPWSVNTLALAFLCEVVDDSTYMEKTWEVTSSWRSNIENFIKEVKGHWRIFGVGWLPFIWIDTGSQNEAEECVQKCSEKGVPIRWGLHGYEKPTFIRIGVRKPEFVDLIVNAIKSTTHSS